MEKKEVEKRSEQDVTASKIIAEFVAANFNGTWVNQNKGARGMIKFTITPGKFNGFGSCTPTPCNWGPTNLTLYSDSVSSKKIIAGTAQYDFGFKKTIITLMMVSETVIKASDYNEFTDGSGRQNYCELNMLFIKS